ncbi:lysophospholipid acyltransferase family protein [Cognatishimia maritima]|uniref:KDO2-lipid IV(A) lauroyltransferase n=1 Tax=Cognatishimia maritima TaxID=870908 RepID=A0A1M5N6L5_9RHOB|nr:lysophospholipid acyltransferase family protein [Cognatishimia maritima]SHG85204.1 KDO2-lipid IV(A) lauroyltransferase [Cognatishimia maritima]
MSTTKTKKRATILERLEFAVIRTILRIIHAMPYERRIPALGWVMQRVIAPLAGYNRRVADNLKLVAPEIDAAERARLVGRTANNVGRTLAELFSPVDFKARARHVPLEGPGVAALEAAKAAGQPIIFVSGHFANYDVIRAALIEQGFDVGGLYRKMNNPLFHDYYVNNISTIGTPLFQRGRKGLGQMLRHLKKGGCLAALIDVRAGNGEPLTYFGHRAWTATSMAEMAVKYNALFVPVFSIRRPDGLSFKTHIDAPIPAGDPSEMTQAFNDILEAQVRENMDQWFWFHKRWKAIPKAQLIAEESEL